MRREVTLKDIARELDLSTSTVARALADHQHISEQTKVRVRDSAAALGYIAHSAARAMRNGQSTLIGLIIPDVQNEFYGTLAKALAQCFDAAGFQLLLAITEDEPESERRQVRGLSEARAAGIVFVPCPQPRKETLALLERGPWVQLIRKVEGVDAPWFGIDEEAALFQATTHLIKLGHRRIAYVGGTTDLSSRRVRVTVDAVGTADRGRDRRRTA
jgi:DNA-binding LacI/PurR family transcriptional regulator